MKRAEPANRAWRCPAPNPGARVRLLCFAHAGAAASAFRPWTELLPPWIELHAAQLPGREDRWGEPALTTMSGVVADLLPGLTALADRPTVLFGHSLGATIAYEAACALGTAAHLVVSGKEPPHRHQRDSFHTAPDAELAAEIARLRGERPTSMAALGGDYLLPILRADYAVNETYRPVVDRERLACPVTALTGVDDGELTSAHAHAWAAYTRADFRAVFVPGDHFHLFDHPAATIAAITTAAGPLAEGTA